jgi:hypothetical protein
VPANDLPAALNDLPAALSDRPAASRRAARSGLAEASHRAADPANPT